MYPLLMTVTLSYLWVATVTGVQDEACPSSRTLSLTALCPYSIKINSSAYTPGYPVAVEMTNLDKGGILLQAVRLDGTPVGHFTHPPEHAILKHCVSENDTIMFADVTASVSGPFTWWPPTKMQGFIFFQASVKDIKNSECQVVVSRLIAPTPTEYVPRQLDLFEDNDAYSSSGEGEDTTPYMGILSTEEHAQSSSDDTTVTSSALTTVSSTPVSGATAPSSSCCLIYLTALAWVIINRLPFSD